VRRAVAFDASPLVFAPSMPTRRSALKAAPLPLVGFVIIMAVRMGWWSIPVCLTVGGLTYLGMWRYIATARVTITSDRIELTGFFGQRRSRPLSDVAAVVRVDQLGGTSVGIRTLRNLFVLDDRGKPITRLQERPWAPDEMDRLTAALGVTPTVIPGLTSANELARRYPGVVKFRELHPMIFGFAIALVLVAVIAGAVNLVVE
jgi:hypothetical protein